MTATVPDSRRIIRKLNIIGFAAVALMVGGLGVWATTGELAGAVIAPGVIVVESNVKKVQHSVGGIVGEILVKEGHAVEAGDVVMRLDDTVTRSTVGVLRSQLDELEAREARLLAERDNQDAISFPEEMLKRTISKNLTAAIAGEEKLFEARRLSRSGQRSQLRERVAQSEEEIRGLTAQQAAKEEEVVFISDELIGVRQLYDKNLVSISRLMTLQRDKSRISGERGQYVAEIARARGKISETEIQILQLDQDFRTDVLKEIREGQGRIAELRERLIAAEDQLKRVDIRAPQSGVILQLAVHTVGGVIANGETIITSNVEDRLSGRQGKVVPQDIDQVSLGAKVVVRIMAGNQRTMPDIAANVVRVSADLTHDPPSAGQVNQPYYQVRIALPRSEIERLSDLRLVPGMPAEAFIQTYPRTTLQYLVKPLHDQIARTFKER